MPESGPAGVIALFELSDGFEGSHDLSVASTVANTAKLRAGDRSDHLANLRRIGRLFADKTVVGVVPRE
jgi:hypothetical protein